MYEDNLARARAQLQTFETDSGQEILLGYVTQAERLCTLIQPALKRVSDDVDTLIEFHDALVQLRPFVDSARETLRRLDQNMSDQYSLRQISHDGVMVVRSLFKTLCSDLDDLFWGLPAESRRPKAGPRPLDLTGGESPNPASQPE